jgi:hypothetical protein
LHREPGKNWSLVVTEVQIADIDEVRQEGARRRRKHPL